MAVHTEFPQPTKARTAVIVVLAGLAAGIGADLTRYFPPLIVVAAAAGLVVVLLISLDPYKALMFLVLARASLEGLQSAQVSNTGGVSVSPTDVLSVAFLGGAALWLFREGRTGNPYWRHPLVPWAVLLLGLSVLTLPYSPSLTLGARDLVKWAGCFSAFLVIFAVRPEPAQLRRILILVVVSSVIPLAIGFYQFVTTAGRVVAAHGGLRVQATFIHPNDYGAYLVSIAVAIWALRPMVHGAARKLVSGMGIAVFVSIMLTLSRSAWIGLGIVILVVGWKYRRLLFGAALGAVGVTLAAPRIFGRATDVLQSSNDTKTVTQTGQLKAGNSLVARFNIWQGEIQEWKQRPFLGHGWGFTYSKQSHGSHNDYLRLLVEGGVVGLAAFVAFMLTLLRTSVRAARGRSDLPLAFLGLTLAYLVQAAGTNAFAKDAYQLYFWVLAGTAYVWAETVPAPSASTTDRAPDPVT